MTLRHFYIFVTVCEKMNMTAAANTLFMSQPAVSQAIAELETHYQVKLFERLARRLYLTQAGNKLLSYAHHILRTTEDAEKEIRSLGENGKIRVGASVTIGATVLPQLVVDFQQAYSHITIEVVEDNTTNIEQLVLRDKLDVGLVEGEVTLSDLAVQPLADDRLVLICGADHHFAGRTAIEPEELEAERFILREAGSGTRNTFESVMAAHALNWKASWVCNNVDTIKAAVGAGLGISIISERTVSKEVELGMLHMIPIKRLAFRRQFKLIHHQNKHLTRGMHHFIGACVQQLSN